MAHADPSDKPVLWYYDIFGPFTANSVVAAVSLMLTGAVLGLDTDLHVMGVKLAPASTVIGFLVIGVGLSKLLWVRGAALDRSRGRVTVWSGMLFPLIVRREPLSLFDAVIIRYEAGVYTVNLGGMGVEAPLGIFHSYASARRRALCCSIHLDLDFVDNAGAEPVRLSAEALGPLTGQAREPTRRWSLEQPVGDPSITLQPAAERARAPGVVIPPPPHEPRSLVAVHGDSLWITLPPSRTGKAWLQPIVGAVVCAVLVGSVTGAIVFDSVYARSAVLFVGATLAGALGGFVMGLCSAWSILFVTNEIEVLPHVMLFTWRGPFYRQTETLRAADVIELRVADPGLVFQTRWGMIRAGHYDLSRAELEWLKGAIETVLHA